MKEPKIATATAAVATTTAVAIAVPTRRRRTIARSLPLAANSRDGRRWMRANRGRERGMRIGNVVIRPLGGGAGCLMMILASIVLSVLLTIVVNVLF
jgi:hypothetical protein